MKQSYPLNYFLFIALLLLSNLYSLNAQENYEITESYEDYTDAVREVAYLHLNKSTYIKGEDIGFTAYVLDKKTKKPSLLTTNLYVSIEDVNQNVIKQKLIKVVDGIASNIFEIDSLFTTGNYKIQAYTNWMRNFKEQNYYTETISIIDVNETETENLSPKIDAQFLPESGHLLHGVVNIIGVTIKDQLGYGIPFAKGEVINENNEVLSTFKTNQFGIGKFQLLPEHGNAYDVKINYSDQSFSTNLNTEIEHNGVILSLKKIKSKVFISLKTNEETLESIKNNRYTLMLHNGDLFEVMDVYFNDVTEISKVIDISNMASGTNIITLFNENDQPIAERLFFNYEGIKLINQSTITTVKEKDSIEINLNFKDINPNTNNSISISVLPEDSKSYNRRNNIISYTYLAPYINGLIEQPKYYFTEIDSKKEYELDNLLITQGWSSYNWDDIFKNTQDLKYPFEQGITINANRTSKDINGDIEMQYLVHAVDNESPRVFPTKKGESNFIIENVFPIETEAIYFSKMTKNEDLKPASLYLQFFPNTIPKLKNDKNDLPHNSEQSAKLKPIDYNRSDLLNISSNVQRLKEVVVKSNPGLEKRLEQNDLGKGRFGKITTINEQDLNIYITLADYVKYKILNGNDFNTTGRLDLKGFNGNGASVSEDSSTDPYGNILNYYLDDSQVYDISFFRNIYLTDIAYVEFNKFGVGEGMRSPKGFIRIYTKDSPKKYLNNTTVQAYNFPLKFSPNKKFYIPKYKYYNDDFYKNFGVIDWQPNLNVDNQSNISFKIAKPKVPFNLHIEGIANDGSYVYEKRTINKD
ncbi:hypothetical protein HNV10_14750 [Winogradskyella litoriviva]|uniref:MG2 domain-containing protein n=1 Tax=Winogradskyella litoriviva TaxID=1220182 RepID=A0ABX2E7W8_9FLAO|nr:hypothetical protein [Winogradskyella litoriviva]NRD24515.1 hypothetical protein [Winogradskyella litoriviva]